MHPCVSLQMKFKCVQKSEPKSEWAQLDLVAIPRPSARCVSRLSVRLSIASPSQIKVASLQLPFISFVMCSDYIKFYSGEPSSHTHTERRRERSVICIGMDTIRYLSLVCIGNAIKLKLSAMAIEIIFVL